MDKHSLYSPLIEALKDEIKSHACLLDVIREETRVLSQNRLPDLLDIGVKKGDVFRRTEAVTHRRTEIMNHIIAFLGIEAHASVTQLAALADVQNRQILTDYREKFADILCGIESANEANRQIIASTLAHINHHIHFIRRITATLPHYDQHGQIRDGNLHGGLISQAG
jgi:flagellar biosynthesis/type III secretory pathway chaperone